MCRQKSFKQCICDIVQSSGPWWEKALKINAPLLECWYRICLNLFNTYYYLLVRVYIIAIPFQCFKYLKNDLTIHKYI